MLDGITCSYNTFSCGDGSMELWQLFAFSNVFLTQRYVTINVMMVLAVNVTMKVTINVITATAIVDLESPDIPLPVEYNS